MPSIFKYFRFKQNRANKVYLLLILAIPVFAASEPSPLIQQLKATEIALNTLAPDYEKTLKEIAQQETTLATLTKAQTESQRKTQIQRNLVLEEIKQAYLSEKPAPIKTLLNQDDFSKTSRMLNYHRQIINARLNNLSKNNAPMQQLDIHNQEIAALADQLNQLKILRLQQHQTIEYLQQTREDILKNPEFTPNSNSRNLEKLLAHLDLSANVNMPAKIAMRHFCLKKISPTEGEIEILDQPDTGILIHTAENQDVRAIAKGKVIYADWLEGYGLLLIIDHGRGYVSLYGRNYNIYKTANSRVAAGEIIANVGKTGGYEQPALYFAIRYNKKPFDPERWCKNKK